MNQTCTAISSEKDSARAGAALGRKIRDAFRGAPADAVAVFASAQHDHTALLESLARESGSETIVGASSAGEFSEHARGNGQISALGIRGDGLRFSVGHGAGISRDAAGAAREAVAGFRGIVDSPMPYRAALVMTDALAGHADALVEQLTVLTRGNYSFFGGGAGDDAKFTRTHVFAGTRAYSDALVALEILSMQPLGIGVSHGWIPAGAAMRVTEANGTRLASLNGEPAVHAMEEHARATGQKFERADPMPFFLHNILGIKSDGSYRLRVPLGVNPDGSLALAAEVPAGTVVHIMKTTDQSAVQAAEKAARAALAALGGRQPSAGLVFDCVATRLRLGTVFDDELRSCAELLKPAGFVGCNTYGQIARAEGQFNGFHNCTAVVCVIPQ